MFTRFLTYVRSWKLEVLDNLERIRSDPSIEQRLMFVLVDLADTGSTDCMINQPNGFKLGALFFWLNLMEFIVNFSVFTRNDQGKLLKQIRQRWAQLDAYFCLFEIDQIKGMLSYWREDDQERSQMIWVNKNLQEIRQKLKYLCKPVPAWNAANPWMLKPSMSFHVF